MLKDKSVLIVEDELLIATHLKTIIASFECKKIELAHTKKTAIAAFENFKPDLIILDINLENKNDGVELAAYINQTTKVPFIFVTAYSDMQTLTKALTQHPAAYITKPFKQTDVLAAIQLVFINNPNLNKVYINFKYGSEFVRLATSEIHLVKREGNYIKIYSATKKYLLRNSIDWVLDKLPEDIFLRVNRSIVINLFCIDKHTSEYVSVQNIQIPISRKIKHRLLEKIATL